MFENCFGVQNLIIRYEEMGIKQINVAKLNSEDERNEVAR
jgi:hypothetical protein